jgi:CheY-like chemotaxis protein
MPTDADPGDTHDNEPWEAAAHAGPVLLVEDNPINREVALQLLHGSAWPWTPPKTAPRPWHWRNSATTTWC